MNRSFSFIRIIDILKRKFVTNRKIYLIFLTIFFFIDLFMCFVYSSMRLTNEAIATSTISFSPSFDTLVVVIMAGIIPFLELSNRNNRIFELLYPASQKEKFIVELFVCFVLIPTVILLVDMIAMFLGAEFCKLVYPNALINMNFSLSGTLFSSLSAFFLRILLAMSISFFGSVLFKKYRLVKIWTIVGSISFVLLIMVTIYVVQKVSNNTDVFPYSYITEPLQDSNGNWVTKQVLYYNGERLDRVPWFLSNVFWNIVISVMSLAFLVSSWFVYKKKTI